MPIYGRVSRDQRFTRRNPCPICEGGDGDKRHRGLRCYGFLGTDEHYAICTNDDFAGALTKNARTGGYKHKLSGPCHCGEEHGAAFTLERIRPARPAPEGPSSDPPKRSHLARTPDAIYDYGEGLRFLRFGSGKGKSFVWQHADGASGWLDGRGDTQPRLYRAGEVATADPWAPVFIPEGEKCVDALAERGQMATCNPDGAGKWGNAPDARETLRGRHVVILADADEPGRAHAAQIVADVVRVAASVRVLELDGAHDVADWLTDGHTVDELRRLAAATECITACKSPAQETNPALQDGRSLQTPETCPNCQQWADRARIAETTVTNLRREQAMAARILALPNEKLAAPVKLAAIAVREVLTQPRARNEQGMELVYRRAISQRCGVSDQTAGAHLRKLEGAGVIHREVVKTFDRSEIYISEGTLFDTPEQIEATGRTWGGHRVKHCTACGGDNLEVRVTCRDCGAVLSIDDVNKPGTLISSPAPQDGFSTEGADDSDAQTPAQDNSLPVGTILSHLATDGQQDDPAKDDPSPAPDRCAARPGAHVYALLRTADGRRVCVACEMPEAPSSEREAS